MRPFLLAASLAAASLAQAQPFQPLAPRLPVGARSLAMANVAIVGRDDDVIFFNPAQLVIARGTSVSVADVLSSRFTGGSMATVLRFGTGGIGVGVNQLDFGAGAMTVRDRSDLAAGSTGSSSHAMVGLAQVVKGVRVGAALSYLAERLDAADRSTRRAVGLDIGASRDWRRISVGATLQHIGPDAFQRGGDHPDLPFAAAIGLGYSRALGPLDLLAMGQVRYREDGFVAPSAGGELGFSWLDGYLVAVRAGARRPDVAEGILTGGVGFTADRVSLDWAVEPIDGRPAIHHIGIRIR